MGRVYAPPTSLPVYFYLTDTLKYSCPKYTFDMNATLDIALIHYTLSACIIFILERAFVSEWLRISQVSNVNEEKL